MRTTIKNGGVSFKIKGEPSFFKGYLHAIRHLNETLKDSSMPSGKNKETLKDPSMPSGILMKP